MMSVSTGEKNEVVGAGEGKLRNSGRPAPGSIQIGLGGSRLLCQGMPEASGAPCPEFQKKMRFRASARMSSVVVSLSFQKAESQ